MRDLEAEQADATEVRAGHAADLEAHDVAARARLEAIDRRIQALPPDDEDALAAHQGERDEAAAEVSAVRANLAATLAESETRVERIAARRRATLVDLGREVVRAEPDDATASAHESLAHIETLRVRRRALITERDDIDTGPITRTVGAALTAIVFTLAVTSWVL